MSQNNTDTIQQELPQEPFDATSFFGFNPEEYRRDLAVYGLNPDWLGYNRQHIDPDDYQNLWRFQYVKTYDFPQNVKRGNSWDSEVGNLQFKTIIYTLGKPKDPLTDHLQETVNAHLRGLFNTGPYDHYLEGFSFVRSYESEELQQVGPDEITRLGIPQWEVEAYDADNNLGGVAAGLADPFTFEGYTPGGERWELFRKDESRGSYEVGPAARTAARERTNREEMRGKRVLVNGHTIGTITTRGTTELRMESSRKYTTREELIAEGVPYQALSLGSYLYKVGETSDQIAFVTADRKHAAQEPQDPDEVDPEATGEGLTLDVEQTRFRVEQDEQIGRFLGKYDPPVTRTISREFNG